MLILITKDLLDDPMALFNSNQALTDSIMNKGGDKYVPIFEDRNTMRSLRTPTYIKVVCFLMFMTDCYLTWDN